MPSLKLDDSWLRCPKDSSVMAVDPAEREGQARVTHFCLECGYSERNLAERPQKTDSTFLRGLRERLWTEVAP